MNKLYQQKLIALLEEIKNAGFRLYYIEPGDFGRSINITHLAGTHQGSGRPKSNGTASMNPQVVEFMLELGRKGIETDYRTASHLYAYVEQKTLNDLVKQGKRTGQCEICGGEM